MALSEAIKEEVQEMLRADMPVSYIHEETGVSTSVIYSIRRQLGLGRRDVLSGKDTDGLLKRYVETDIPVTTLCREHGITVNKLYQLLDASNTPKRRGADHQKARKAQLDQAVQMYIEGTYYWEILRDTGVTQPSLTAELHKRGVPLRRGA